MVYRLLSEWCVATSFYQSSANHVYFYALFNLRNLLYLIICDTVILYADRDSTEEELRYINQHSFEKAYAFAEEKNWNLERKNAAKLGGSNNIPGQTSRKEKDSDKVYFSAAVAGLGGGACIIAGIVFFIKIILNDGSFVGACIVLFALDSLGLWLCKHGPKNMQGKMSVAEEREMIECEYQQALDSQKFDEPWAKRYSTNPCPYCGHYKVRYAKWDDKKMSVAFWGIASSAIDKHYKCEYCKKMW